MPKTRKVNYTRHALARMSERGIRKEFIERAVEFGELRYFEIWPDPNTGARKKNIKEYRLFVEGRGRLVVILLGDYGLVVTAYFDAAGGC
jgi:hypothetical protein